MRRYPSGDTMRETNFSVQIAMLASLGGILVWPAAADAQTYQVGVEESGPLSSQYTKRNNWRLLPDYRHTTMVANSGSPTLCSESPCLDDDLPGGGDPPDKTRGGTATAKVSGMSPGRYRIELRYNQTVNRTTAVPWAVNTDGVANNTRAGTLNQRETSPGASNWLVLDGSAQNPVDVVSTATFVFGSDSVTFNGSLSYGGVRLVKVADTTSPDAGDAGNSPACSELRSNEYADAEAALNVSLGSTERLTYTIDDVPNPAEIDHAELSMWLHDADHPGEEGTVFVNGDGPLALPADTSWNDATAQAVLVIPVGSLQTGHNVIEFGAGSLAATTYAVSRVALQVEGSACAAPPDAGTPQDAGLDGWWPVDGNAGGASGEDARHDGPAASADASGSAATQGDDSGCACSAAASRRSSAGWFWWMLPAALGLRRRTRGRLESHTH